MDVVEDSMSKVNLDETLYSRQLYVLGRTAMDRMGKSNVLISGLGGLGVEITKNIILGGVRSVTLHDPRPVTWTDFSSNMYLKEGTDFGKNRAEVSAQNLKDLNAYVAVRILDQNTENQLRLTNLHHFDTVVLTEGFQTVQNTLEVSAYCHDNGVRFILCETRGLFARVFCDFGPAFEILNPRDDEPMPFPVSHISRDEEGHVFGMEKSRHKLRDGDFVKFFGIRGMTQLNEDRMWKVKVKNFNEFTIGDTRGFPKFGGGGYAIRVTVPEVKSYKKLEDAVLEPKFVQVDARKSENLPLHVHSLFCAMDEFILKNQRPAQPQNEQDMNQILVEARKFLRQLEKKSAAPQKYPDQLDKKLAECFISGYGGMVSPTASLIGGLVGHEVMKSCSQIFTPLNQWLFFEAAEAMFSQMVGGRESPKSCSNGITNLKMDNYRRHASQIQIFGQEFQYFLANIKIFVVGAGAIGCELLKNFALMGLGSGPSGKIVVTDMDSIEKSNLNRQVLFRAEDIGSNKAEAAKRAVKNINPATNIEGHGNAVGPDNEVIYDDKFYDELDCIANALDNIPARVYMNEMCGRYWKPLFESGTHGNLGNVQVIIPGLTKDYTAPDVGEVEPQPCTIKKFPNAIHHTVQWAREKFEKYFGRPAKNLMHYTNDGPAAWADLATDDCRFGEILSLQTFLDDSPHSFLDCVDWARIKLEKSFDRRIRKCILLFPRDAQNAEGGGSFWSSEKKFPRPYQFPSQHTDDAKIVASLGIDFVFFTAKLRAKAFGIEVPASGDKSLVADYMYSNPKLPESFELSHKSILDDVTPKVLSQLQSQLPPPDTLTDLTPSPLIFDKDNDDAIDFLTAASNLRAWNFEIEPADRLRTKQIVGRIIPAIATTTSVIAALVCLELYKFFQVKFVSVKKFENFDHHHEKLCVGSKSVPTEWLGFFKNCSVNLSTPFMGFFMPEKAKKFRYNETDGGTFDLWSRFIVEEDMTLREFLEHFRKKHDLIVIRIFVKESFLVFRYAKHLEEHNEALMDLQISEVVGQTDTSKFIKLWLNARNVPDGLHLPPVYYRPSIKK